MLSLTTARRKARRIVESTLGVVLPSSVEVHHVDCNERNNEKQNLVVCQDHAYHMLLHVRQSAYDACGNANYRKCWYCKEYDSIENLASHRRQYHHLTCKATYSRAAYAKEH